MGLHRGPALALSHFLARRLPPLVAVFALAACKSTAPYTLPAAAINTGLAAGAAALTRSAGGCYAQCVGGTVCNPATGFCEPRGAVCLGLESDPPSCQVRAPGATMGASATVPGEGGETVLPVGISPATGSVPPPPGARPAPPGTAP